MIQSFILINTTSKRTRTPIKSKRRIAKTGPWVDHPLAIELRQIDEEIHLLGAEFAREISQFDHIPLSRELYQLYLQGYVRTDDLYVPFLARVRHFLKYRRKLYSRLMDADMRSIFDGWIKSLNINGEGRDGSPFRLFCKMVSPSSKDGKKIDPSTVFRWYQNNKKPASIETLIFIDEQVSATVQK